MNFYKDILRVFLFEHSLIENIYFFALFVLSVFFGNKFVFKFLIFVFTLPLLSRGKLGTNYTLKFQQKVVSK